MTEKERLIKELENYEPYAVHFPHLTVNGKLILDVLRLLREQPDKDINVPSKWISVKDRMPKLAGRYLAYRPRFWAWGRGQATVCYWDGKNWFDDYVDTEEYKLSEDSVSHWMPLPEPPGVKQE